MIQANRDLRLFLKWHEGQSPDSKAMNHRLASQDVSLCSFPYHQITDNPIFHRHKVTVK